MSAPTSEQRAEWRALSSVTTGNSVLAVLDRRILALLDALDAAERDRDIVRHAATVAAVTPCSCSAQRARAEAAEEKVQRVRAALIESAPPINSELRYDGTEDPVGAAYLCGYKDAWDTVDAALGPATTADFARGWFAALADGPDQ